MLIPVITKAQLYAELEIGIINDPDGFTYIRNGQELKASVIDTLHDGEFFQFVPNDSTDWLEVYKMWNVKGFVHKSRIKNIKNLQKPKQKALIDSVFSKELKLHIDYFSESKKRQAKASKFHEEKFSPVLNLFIYYMNRSYDEMLMSEFFNILIVESGSADELPSWTLGYIYMSNPKEVIDLVRKYDKELINSHLEFGFVNVTYGRKDEIENFEYLEKQIEEITTANKK